MYPVVPTAIISPLGPMAEAKSELLPAPAAVLRSVQVSPPSVEVTTTPPPATAIISPLGPMSASYTGSAPIAASVLRSIHTSPANTGSPVVSTPQNAMSPSTVNLEESVVVPTPRLVPLNTKLSLAVIALPAPLVKKTRLAV